MKKKKKTKKKKKKKRKRQQENKTVRMRESDWKFKCIAYMNNYIFFLLL